MDSEQKYAEILRQLRDLQQRYVLFVTTLSSAAIGYCVSLPVPSAAELDWSYALLLGAMIFWALSIFLGVTYMRGVMKANLLNMKFFDGWTSGQKLTDAHNQLKEMQPRYAKIFNWTFYTLIIGVTLFFFWHVSRLPIKEAFCSCS